MRIIAGSLGGRIFDAPASSRTHPMSEKMRGALFNVLGDISGLTVLDAFAGSGALAFEALSRGASLALLIDIDRQAQKTISENIKQLNLGQNAKLVKMLAGAWSSSNYKTQFDLVLCDPPYDEVKPDLLQQLSRHVKTGGIMVLSLPPEETIELPSDFGVLSTKSYGDSKLVFYRKKSYNNT